MPDATALHRRSSDRSMIEQMQKQREIALEASGNQEMFADVLVAVRSKSLGKLAMGKQKANLIGGPFNRVRQQAGMLVNHLPGNTAHRRGHYRLLLPQSLGNGKPEPLAQTLLNDHRRGALERVDLERTRRRKLQDADVGVIAGGFTNLPQHRASFGIVRCTPARQNELAIEVTFDDLIDADDPDRIFEAIKT